MRISLNHILGHQQNPIRGLNQRTCLQKMWTLISEYGSDGLTCVGGSLSYLLSTSLFKDATRQMLTTHIGLALSDLGCSWYYYINENQEKSTVHLNRALFCTLFAGIDLFVTSLMVPNYTETD